MCSDEIESTRYELPESGPWMGHVSEPRPSAPHESPQFSRLLELIGRRWTANILRQLLFEPGRFNRMSRELGINPNTLRVRLLDLENEGLVSRVVESSFPPKVRYDLTERGRELASILDRLVVWAEAEPALRVSPGVAEPRASYGEDGED